MNIDIKVDPDMLRRLTVARDHGSSLAQSIIDVFDADTVPDEIKGDWSTKRITRHGRVREIRVKFKQKGGWYTQEMALWSFVRKVLKVFDEERISDFVKLFELPSRVSMRVVTGKKDIRSLFSGDNFFSACSSRSVWAAILDTGVYNQRFGAMCADFFTDIMPTHFLVCQSERGKILGYAPIILNGILKYHCRDGEERLFADIVQQHIVMSPRYAFDGVYTVMVSYVKEHFKELNVDMLVSGNDISLFTDTTRSAIPEHVDLSLSTCDILSPLHACPTYKGGFPNEYVASQMRIVVDYGGYLCLATAAERNAIIWNSSSDACLCRGAIERCPRCKCVLGSRSTSKYGLCPTCDEALAGKDTIFGRVYTTKFRKIKGFGKVPSAFLLKGGKLNPEFQNALMIMKFRDDYHEEVAVED